MNSRLRSTLADSPTISVVVPTFNRAQWLGEALATIANQQTGGRFTFDIHAVDNGSTDATREVVERVSAESPVDVHYWLQPRPGDAAARNLGVNVSRGQWLAFFDDDQLAEPDWLAELYAIAFSNEACIVGGAVHLNLDTSQRAQLDPLCRQALRETRLYDEPREYRRGDLPGAGNLLVDRQAFVRLGPFDESMTGGGSDCDWLTRARDAGLAMWYAPRAVVRHRVPAERLSPEYLRWDAMSGGAGHAAYFDYRRRGVAALLLLCVARIAAALLVHLPLLAWARLRGDRAAQLGRKSRLWRIEGYVRRTLSIVAPRWFPQRRFLDSLELRQARSLTG